MKLVSTNEPVLWMIGTHRPKGEKGPVYHDVMLAPQQPGHAYRVQRVRADRLED